MQKVLRKHTWSGHRTLLGGGQITLLGWPSRGGVIVLEWASYIDLNFLGFNNLEPPLHRAADQAEEDEFCKRLLLLGARWFDNETRWQWFESVEAGNDVACEKLESGEIPEPTFSERRWIRVGWQSSDTDSTGGFWIVEHDNHMNYGEEGWHEPPRPHDLQGRLMLCKDMAERCKMLQAFGAKFYEKLDDYDGHGFLKAWQEKYSGEVGPLLKTSPA